MSSKENEPNLKKNSAITVETTSAGASVANKLMDFDFTGLYIAVSFKVNKK